MIGKPEVSHQLWNKLLTVPQVSVLLRTRAQHCFAPFRIDVRAPGAHFPLKTWVSGLKNNWVWGKINHQGTAGFNPCFHLPGLHSGYLFLTYTQIRAGGPPRPGQVRAHPGLREAGGARGLPAGGRPAANGGARVQRHRVRQLHGP